MSAADHHGPVADPDDVDAERLGRVRVLADRPHPQAERRAEEHQAGADDHGEHGEEDRLVREQLRSRRSGCRTGAARRWRLVGTPVVIPVSTITSERRNPVTPRANRLITTPEMIWSTRNVTDSRAWSSGDQPAGDDGDADRQPTAPRCPDASPSMA